MTLLAIVVLAAWVAYKNWSTAWTVGGCFLTFAAAASTWMHYVHD